MLTCLYMWSLCLCSFDMAIQLKAFRREILFRRRRFMAYAAVNLAIIVIASRQLYLSQM